MSGRLRSTLGRPALVGVALIGAGVGAVLLAFASGTSLIPIGSGDQPVRAAFASTNELRPGDQVRVQGIEVGSVEDIEVVDGGRSAVVTMAIDDAGVEVKSDARASTRWRTLLGGSPYVDLEPGSPGAPALADDVIALDRTTEQVELDELFEPLAGRTPDSIRGSLREVSRALADERAVGSAVRALPRLETVARGLQPLRGQRADDLRALVAGAGRTVRAIDRGDRIAELVSGGAATFGAVASAREALGQGLDLAPGALDVTRSTMERLRGTLDRLDPLADELSVAVAPLDESLERTQPTLDEATRLLDEARPLLRELPPGLRSLGQASRAGVPMLASLTPALERVDETLIPYLERRDDETKLRNYESFGPTLAVLNSTGSEYDGGGNVLHFPTLGNERSLTFSPCQTFITDPSATEMVRCDALEDLLSAVLAPPPRSEP